jgi:Mrp family chromosome partitioning ATPase
MSVAILLLTGVALGAYLFTHEESRADTRYRVGVQVLIAGINDDEDAGGIPPAVALSSQARRALDPETTQRALDAADVPEAEREEVGFGFNSDPESRGVVTLDVTSGSPERATAVAAAYSDSFIQTRRQTTADGAKDSREAAGRSLDLLYQQLDQVDERLRAIDPALLSTPVVADDTEAAPNVPANAPRDAQLLLVQRDELTTRIRATQTEYALADIESIIPQSFASTIEVLPPDDITPPLPSPVTPALAILGVGILAAIAAPILRERFDSTIRTAKSAAAAFDAPVLTSIPPVARRHERALASTGSPRESAYRALAATSIATDQLPRAIVVTSPTGTSQDTVAANFAAALAELGVRVALIGTDPRQRWFLEASGTVHPGLNFPQFLDLALDGRLNGQVRADVGRTQFENLVVVGPGPSDEPVVLDGLRPLLESLAEEVDVTVIAGPSLLEDPAATIYAWTTRSVLWAFESGEITEAEAKEAASRLTLAGAVSFGVAMIDATP